MDSKLYIEGCQLENGQIICPLPSSVILFIARYCQYDTLSITFVSEEKITKAIDCCTFEDKILSDLNVSFTLWKSVPDIVKNVTLPSVFQSDRKLVRSGLCVVLRHIIKQAHDKSPLLKLIDLLGFRCGCMKMCAEVSGWTKLCEVDLPKSVAQLLSFLRSCASSDLDKTLFTLPSDLVRLEEHFLKKCLVHNEDKKQRADLLRIKEYFTETESEGSKEGLLKIGKPFEDDFSLRTSNGSNCVRLNALSLDSNGLYIEQTVPLRHGIRKYRVNKKWTKEIRTEEKDKCYKSSPESQPIFSQRAHHTIKNDSLSSKSDLSQTAFNFSELQVALDTLIHFDVEYVHVYSEGVEMTVADLIIFTYLYYLLEKIDFDCYSISTYLPQVIKWASHMTSIPTVQQAGATLGYRMEDMKKGFLACSLFEQRKYEREGENKKRGIQFQCEELKEDVEDKELSRNTKMKHKAIKPEVIQALKNIETLGIQPMKGSHPKGEAVQVNWDSLPKGINPKEGGVPIKRAIRKCQQLENLATAIQAIAEPGNVIVDFCSGGGHLGIVLAFLLPECQVFLVENKEESLLNSCSRLKSLGLTNVSLYQCNMDYFIGKFDIGTCLHACGSATDMVLQLCLQSEASFVICPCCYGSIHNTHLLSYPRSKHFSEARVSYKDFLTLGHAADQTEFNIALEEQGRMCMCLIDTDRAHYARELQYTVSLCSLKPLSCTPKNNLLIGTLKK